MKKGDILLIHSKLDPIAWIIRKASNSHWNHVAWAVDTHFLIEARGRAIDKCSIKKYLNWRYEVKLIRLKKVTKDQFKEGIEYVSQLQGERKYLSYLKTILRMVFMEDEIRYGVLTCSGLIARGLEEAGFSFIPNHKKISYQITPEDISKAKARNVTSELKKVSL